MSASRTSFSKGKSGNPAGRAKGSRNRASLAVDALLEGEAGAITRKAIDMAKAGDATAIRLCLDRLAPVRRDRPIEFALPPIQTTGDLTKATSALLTAVAAGEITPSEAAELGRLVDSHVKAIEVTDLDARLRRIEEGTR